MIGKLSRHHRDHTVASLGVLFLLGGLVTWFLTLQTSAVSPADYSPADFLHNLAEKATRINSIVSQGSIVVSNVLPAAVIEANFNLQATGLRGTPEWSLNLAGGSSAGGLLSDFNLDFWRRDHRYYLRLNQLPELFLDQSSSLGGHWLELTDTIANYRGETGLTTQVFESLVEAVTASGFVEFARPPVQETVAGHRLWRYDLKLAPAAAGAFARQLSTRWGNTSFLNRLTESELALATTRYNEKAELAVWLDGAGWPVLARQTSPEVTFEINFSQINRLGELGPAPEARSLAEALARPL